MPTTSTELAKPDGNSPGRPVVMSTDEFKSLLVEHLKANEASVANQSKYPALTAPPNQSGALVKSNSKPPRRSKIMREARKGKKRGGEDPDRKTVLVAQVDTDALRQQGFKVSDDSAKTTIITSKDGKVEHILEGCESAEEVKSFLSRKYNILSQQQGTGYITLPTREDPEGLKLDLLSQEKPFSTSTKGSKGKKKKKGRITDGASATKSEKDDETLTGFPFVSEWSEENRNNFKKHVIKGIERATTGVEANAKPSSSSDVVASSHKDSDSELDGLSLPEVLLRAVAPPYDQNYHIEPVDPKERAKMPSIEVSHIPGQVIPSPPGSSEPAKVTMTTRITIHPPAEVVEGMFVERMSYMYRDKQLFIILYLVATCR